MHLVRNGVVANYDPFASCSTIPQYKNGIHYRDVPDGLLAIAPFCYTQVTPGTDLIDSFQVVFDPDFNWYRGVDYSGIGSSQFDVFGQAAHEFGHVVGGWIDPGGSCSDCVGGHYDPTRNGALCRKLGVYL